MKICQTLILAAVAIGMMPTSASAITVDVAKKCDALIAQRFPPRIPGNPAAGSAAGSAQVQRDFFQKCVANSGKMDDADAGKQK